MSWFTNVDGAAYQAWKDETDQIIRDLARTSERFSSDEIWYELERRGIDTQEHRAMGPRIVKATKDGVIKIADCAECGTVKVTINSTRTDINHGSNIAVYESLVYGTA